MLGFFAISLLGMEKESQPAAQQAWAGFSPERLTAEQVGAKQEALGSENPEGRSLC